MPAKINIEMTKLWLARSLFQHNPEFPSNGTNQMTSISLNIVNSGIFTPQNTEAESSLFFQIKPMKETPFFLEAEYRAQFTLSQPIFDEERPYYINEVFPQLLFPFMREYIAETTRRGGFPPFLINTGIALAPRRPEASSSPLEYTPFAQKAPEATVKSPPKDEAGPSAPGGRKAPRKTTRKADGSSPDGLPNSPSGPPTDTGSQPGSEAGSGSNNDSESPSNSQTLSPNAAFKWTH